MGFPFPHPGLLIMIVCLLLSLYILDKQDRREQEQRHMWFMDECTEDRKEYECEVLWGQTK